MHDMYDTVLNIGDKITNYIKNNIIISLVSSVLTITWEFVINTPFIESSNIAVPQPDPE